MDEQQPRTFDDGPAEGEDLHFTCPRCDQQASARFYGPCDDCRAALRADLGSEQRDVAAAEYEPKMNVTPNAIATKD